MKHPGILLTVIAFTLVSNGTIRAADKTPTILAMGDSITQGSKNFACYREFLIPELRKQGVNFRFIGPNRDATSAHAGYGGRNTAYLLRVTKDIYSRYPADIVLLHAGHNHFSRNQPIPGILRDTKAIIGNIRSLNPQAKILLAQVIPAGKLPKYSYIPELNRQLASLAAELRRQNHEVTVVNCAEGFDWRTDTVKDKVHPNAAGAKKMTDQWLKSLLPLLSRKP